MKILMLLEGEFPPDERVEKQALSLIKAGHTVSIACYTMNNKSANEIIKGIQIHRKAISKFVHKSSAACLVLPFYFSFWKRYVKQLQREYSFDALHIHDLPLSKVGYYISRRYSLKLICDQHEYYSNWIVHTAHMKTILGRVIKRLSNWKRYEKYYLSKADAVLTVEEPLRELYIKNKCVESSKIITLPNTPLGSVFTKANIKEDITKNYKDKFVLFYAGGLDRLRGLDMAITALPIIKKSIPNIQLVLAGKLSKGFDVIGLVESLGISDIVEYHPWINLQDFASYLAATKVGFFTPPGNRDEIHNTIATKIYQYLAMEVPVIVSEVRLMKQFVETLQIGYCVKSKDEFAMRVIELYKNPELHKEIALNCRKHKQQYTWEHTVKPLLDTYSRI